MKFQIDRALISDYSDKIIEYVKNSEFDCLYISSADHNINEYVPLYDNLRYYITGFTGSVAEVLCTSDEIFIFVDGRYHEQVDLECESPVRPVKVDMNETLIESMKSNIRARQFKKIGIVGSRTPASLFHDLRSVLDVENVKEEEVLKLISLVRPELEHQLVKVEDKFSGEDHLSKFSRVCKKGEAIFVNALDTIAWLTNLRGYELPYQATFKAKALLTNDCLYLFSHQYNVDKGRDLNLDGISWNLTEKMEEVFQGLCASLSKVHYDEVYTTVDDLEVLDAGFTHEKIYPLESNLTLFHALKNEAEVKGFEYSFEKSDMAIWNTMAWLKRECSKREVNELEFYTQGGIEYKKQGALGQSFHTIAGFGSNSSIIHFGNSSEDKKYEEGEFALMDSGGFYEPGLATDCTRAIIPHGEAQDWQKEIYTLVLQGLLKAQMATFEAGTLGEEIDALARNSIEEAGYNYAHGTGHGVGINVHEGCYRLKPGSKVPLQEGLVGSIEPGIYLPGKGGVRLENIVVVEKVHPDRDLLCFRPFVFIGFEPDLIDFSLLSEEEKNYLQEYEQKCSERGRSLLF
ncbi:MAG: M24 family metallopeptidase [Oligoflexia bacterium]|nr:M24 family metallopeptidase [Oligoflexia bacterium]